MTTTLTIRKCPSTWSIRAGGAVVGESSDALELCEGANKPAYYFPRSDIGMAFMEPSDTKTTCPQKGDASYFSIVLKSATLKDAAWSYEAPRDAAAQIAGYIAFDHDMVTVEET